MEENIRVGAEHEVAHALPYLAHGRPFIDVEVDGIGCGAVHVQPWAGRQDEVACIKMAGPAADFAFLVNRDGEDDAFETVVNGWCELLDVTHPDGDPDAMRSDQARAASTGLMAYGFAWAVGFLMANRALISELAAELLRNGGRLRFDEVVAVTDGRLRGADEMVTVQMHTALGRFSSVIEEVQTHVQAVLKDVDAR